MASLDTFLAPVTATSPSGSELRNDARFHAIERLVQPASRTARSQAADADPAVDWAEVLRLCEELATEGRDLRLLAIVARALAGTEGFGGAAAGLSLLSDAVATYWDSVHPELRDRPSPREAAVRRVNALYQIENEEEGLLCDLSHLVVFDLRGLGRFTGADLAAASLSRAAFLNEVPQGLGEAEKAALGAQHEVRVGRVRTACRALAAERPDDLSALAAAVAATREALGILEDRISARVAENGAGVRFTQLGRFLERVAATLERGASPEAAIGQEGSMDAAIPIGAAPAAPAGPIASRRDVERALDGIIAFYEATEPASPLPLLARRMRRLVPMTFLQLMEELAPGGLKEVRNLAGTPDEKTKS